MANLEQLIAQALAQPKRPRKNITLRGFVSRCNKQFPGGKLVNVSDASIAQNVSLYTWQVNGTIAQVLEVTHG